MLHWTDSVLREANSVLAKARVVASLLVAFAASIATYAENGPLFQFLEKPGPHGVGLKVVEQYDYSRTYRHSTDDVGKPYQGERALPLQTLICYPAKRSSAKPMTVGDYGNLMATETSFGKPKLGDDAKEWIAGMAPTLATPLWAVRGAPLESGRFPVVVYAPSFSSMSWENADLCEYLASHGYVVIASPDMGAMTRDMTGDVAGINAQARDISFLIGWHSRTDISLWICVMKAPCFISAGHRPEQTRMGLLPPRLSAIFRLATRT
jgi:hypothetical protein